MSEPELITMSELKAALEDPDEAEKRLRLRIISDPIFFSYFGTNLEGAYDKVLTGPIKTVSDVLARRGLYAIAIATETAIGTDENMKTTHVVSALMAEASIPYLWDSLLFEMAAIGEMPPHVVGPFLPFPYVWLTFEQPIALPTVDFPVDVIQLVETDNEIVGFARGKMMSVEECNLEGRKLPRLAFGTQFNEAPSPWPEIISAISFMDSPYVVRVHAGLNRRQRRNSGRGRADEEDPHEIVRFITLRKADYQDANSEAHKAAVAWRNRWLVTAHRRAQWYPSLQSHKIIWIKAHIKGPEGAPLKSRTYKVAR